MLAPYEIVYFLDTTKRCAKEITSRQLASEITNKSMKYEKNSKTLPYSDLFCSSHNRVADITVAEMRFFSTWRYSIGQYKQAIK